ncbi:MAG: NAD(P)H-dependent oxidoreductase [Woeseiaceae bacterium]|jgi:FMN-dependent NADH-azoreductase|nr:NAD(P)H-dependent oxidoreductase [Woeseiaceae bacterium]
MKTRPTILEISASGRSGDSVSRQLSGDLVTALEARFGDATVVRRDLNDGIGFVDEAWIAANLTPDDERTPSQRERLAESDTLIAELEMADVIVIGTPMYNFGVPATLKAWVDQVARARITFRYTENGPVGLLEGKQAYVVLATGGVPVDAPVDFATPYLRHALGFIGITDVTVIAADRLNARGDEAVDAARSKIAELVPAAPRTDTAAA